MIALLKEKNILLGVCGSIAAYKAADLASRLTQAGALVDTVLSEAALKFVSPLTFQSVTGRRAFTDADLWGSQGHVQHVGLGKSAELLLIAPVTANTLARLAHGIADNLLTVTALAASCPLLLAPAMDGGMYTHPATQANVETLKQRGAIFIGPTQGHLASGMSGIGRMEEPTELIGHVRLALSKDGSLAGRRVLVTAGGTQEPIDPVRSITNRSSGKQGFALAQAALDLGASVTLISGPTHLPSPTGARRLNIVTAEEMLNAVLEEVEHTDILFMAAAVADFRPSSPAANKIKKEGKIPEVSLEATPDILMQVSRVREKTGWPRLMVGFAAESEQLLENAQKKMASKRLDLIAANNILDKEAGFNVDTNRVTVLYPDGIVETLPLLSKTEVAEALLERASALLKA